MVKHHGVPYLEVVDEPRMMRGEGAPRSTVFGVLGRTIESPKMKSLGGLVHKAPGAKISAGTVEHHPKLVHTERRITGPAAKTHISGEHYGQVPYPGAYMAHLGKRL